MIDQGFFRWTSLKHFEPANKRSVSQSQSLWRAILGTMWIAVCPTSHDERWLFWLGYSLWTYQNAVSVGVCGKSESESECAAKGFALPTSVAHFFQALDRCPARTPLACLIDQLFAGKVSIIQQGDDRTDAGDSFSLQTTSLS